MQINRKGLIIFTSIILVIVILISVLFFTKKEENNINADYYYTFEYDDNLISQTVKIFDKKGKQQSKYYLFQKDRLITATKGDKAVLTIAELDLKDHPELIIIFDSDTEKKYEVVYKK